jgi:hypothetical protein
MASIVLLMFNSVVFIFDSMLFTSPLFLESSLQADPIFWSNTSRIYEPNEPRLVEAPLQRNHVIPSMYLTPNQPRLLKDLKMFRHRIERHITGLSDLGGSRWPLLTSNDCTTRWMGERRNVAAIIGLPALWYF